MYSVNVGWQRNGGKSHAGGPQFQMFHASPAFVPAPNLDARGVLGKYFVGWAPYLKGMGRDMELRHLRYFVAIAEEGSLTLAAARRLHTAQPSLSRQIRDLE